MTDPSSPCSSKTCPWKRPAGWDGVRAWSPCAMSLCGYHGSRSPTTPPRMRLGPELSSARMKRALQAIARELNIPVTVRRVPGGLMCWRARAEDREHSHDVATRRPSTQQHQPAHPRGCRPKGARDGREPEPETRLASRPRRWILLTSGLGGALYFLMVGAKTHDAWQGYSCGSSLFERSPIMDTPPCSSARRVGG